ncbi:glycosyltransferase family 4 protein [Siminovitchia fordii]|uniref:glycosyltransferase family 4 protein n=1 Tax=Siminovitchia fordii TaxID=254759 RepID=UPI00036452AC|nr:glycosyltransferase family 4 protein [Siminovitchia fordii]
MNILHLCSYYIGNKLYKNLFQELSKDSSLNQEIYVPVRNRELVNKNYFFHPNVKLYYDNILKQKHRFLYKEKIKMQTARVQGYIKDMSSINIMHAHTLYSDGGTAYQLKKKFGIKYILSVRGTDINVFYKFGLHLRRFIMKVLLDAESIIFISNAYKEKTFNLLPDKFVKKIKNKVHVIPNGISDIWFNLKPEINRVTSKNQLLFTGTIDKNKNLKTVLKAMVELNKNEEHYYLHIAGDGPLKEKLERYSERKKIDKYLTFHGQINSNKLIELMDQTDVFVLPSKQETFGISYIEALSRGVPVIYSRGQGIYGLFSEGQVGYAVEPMNAKDIVTKIKLIQNKKDYILNNCKACSIQFTWSKVAEKYKNIYEKLI